MSKGSGWTSERKQRQREAIQRWKPWRKSTGPKSTAGKVVSAQNSRMHGLYSAQNRAAMKAIRALLREQRQVLNDFEST